ncbi:GroES-like protein [Aulographum hederae CBS 113979]|uniref:GroES-like protein n=1 Tax=Aulographum hederae CBS 113979 TaxID=1176131 RepID=A0A6G1HEK9_9PEZI|nr:GroES-like protein [Aulographum hederae CBS 113979]
MSNPTLTLASVLHGPRDLRLEHHHLPPPPPEHLQIAVHTTGLCGSDLHYHHHYRNGDIQVQEPIILGHESSGTVVGIGSSVPSSSFSLGDAVALEVGLPCGKCARCEEGRYNICPDMEFGSSARRVPHAQGTLRSRVNHPAKFCHKLPVGMETRLGALVEPLSVGIHGVRRAQTVKGSKVVVFGAGAVGLLVAAVAKMDGARSVVVVDVDKGRVGFAVERRFADGGMVVEGKRGETIDEQLKIAKELAQEVGKTVVGDDGDVLGQVDIAFECTGAPACLQAAIYACRSGGKVMLIGMGNPIQTLPISAAALREVDLVGVFRYANTYPRGIEIISESEKSVDAPDFRALMTHSFTGLENAEDAFNMAARMKDDQGNLVLKVVIDTSEEQREGRAS